MKTQQLDKLQLIVLMRYNLASWQLLAGGLMLLCALVRNDVAINLPAGCEEQQLLPSYSVTAALAQKHWCTRQHFEYDNSTLYKKRGGCMLT